MSEESRQLEIYNLDLRKTSLLKQKGSLIRVLNINQERRSMNRIDTPPHVIIEIEDIAKEIIIIDKDITEINKKINKLEKGIKKEIEPEEEIIPEEKIEVIIDEVITTPVNIAGAGLQLPQPSALPQPHFFDMNQSIKIGFTSSSTTGFARARALAQIVENDINDYLKTLGHNFTINFVIKDNKGTAVIALDNVKSFKEMGIDLIVGDFWSSQCQASLTYLNENNMLLLTASSTSPILSIANDRLFRVSPHDFGQAMALFEMWKSWGCEAVLTMQRADAWGDGLRAVLEPRWEPAGIEDLGQIRYAGEVKEFSRYLSQANDIITEAIATYGVEKVGMQFYSFDELRTIQIQAKDFPNLMRIIWMSTETGGRSQLMLNDAGDLAVQTRHFSSFIGIDEDTIEFKNFEDRYYEVTKQLPGFFATAHYDACWLLIKCILETGSTEANDIANNIIPISQKFSGLTGSLSLDEYGDRMPEIYEIWGYYENKESHQNEFRMWGRYNGRVRQVNWDDKALVQYAGILRPSIKNYYHVSE